VSDERGHGPRLLLEGRPGVGKTTVARRVADLLGEAGIPLKGFITEEVRESGRRVGFAIEAFDGNRAMLAHVDFPGPPRVSRYGVDIGAFEGIARQALAGIGEGEVVVLDELGKMELASDSFCNAVSDIFGLAVPIVATAQIAFHPFTDGLKRRPDVETVWVNERNRGELPKEMAARLISR
jgi:nucleoside-triphosphatase